jgi:hypothetical protein
MCAGWQLPLLNGVTLLPLPPKSPEFNPVNDIGQFMRDNWVSSRVFKSYEDILDQLPLRLEQLIHMPWKIMSTATRDCVCQSQSARLGGSTDSCGTCFNRGATATLKENSQEGHRN